jgi:ATP-dependent protease HslVU (ClpYQ) peptidase subunit
MSTVVVVCKNNQICIAADTLTKLGDTREPAEMMRGHDKIIKAGENYIGLVGHASLQLVLQGYFAQCETIPAMDSDAAIFEMVTQMHPVLKEKFYLNPKEDDDDPFESSQMDFLIANASGIYGVYSLRSVQEYTKFYAFGSGYKFALGSMKAVYDNLESAEEIARVGVETAAFFDDSTGMPMTSYTLTAN